MTSALRTSDRLTALIPSTNESNDTNEDISNTDDAVLNTSTNEINDTNEDISSTDDDDESQIKLYRDVEYCKQLTNSHENTINHLTNRVHDIDGEVDGNIKRKIAELDRDAKRLNKEVAINALESHVHKAEFECYQLKKKVLELSAKCAEQDERILSMEEDFEARITYLTRENEMQKHIRKSVEALEYKVHNMTKNLKEDSDEN